MKFKAGFLYLSILLLSLFFISCEKEKNNPIDPSTNIPFVAKAVFSPNIINTDTILINGGSHPNDLLTISLNVDCEVKDFDGGSNIESAQWEVRSPESAFPIASGSISLNDAHPVLWDGHTFYGSRSISFHIRRVEVGNFTVSVFAKDKDAHGSNSIIRQIKIIRASRAPVLSDLNAPDTLDIPPYPYSLIFIMNVMAADSDGLNDIAEVFFRNLDSPSDTNKRFYLYDDGIQSEQKYDNTSGDGIYTNRFQIPYNQTPGTYRFEFVAVDQLGLESNKIIHPIVVRQP